MGTRHDVTMLTATASMSLLSCSPTALAASAAPVATRSEGVYSTGGSRAQHVEEAPAFAVVLTGCPVGVVGHALDRRIGGLDRPIHLLR